MAVIVGEEGVVRQSNQIPCRRYGLTYQTDGFVCLDGVVRSAWTFLDGLDHFEVSADEPIIYEIDANGEIDFGTAVRGMEELNKYGTLTCSGNLIEVKCTTKYRWIYVTYRIYLVYSDGSKRKLNYPPGHSFSATVRGYVSFSASGIYTNYFGDTFVIDGYVSGSASNTVTVTDASGYGDLAAGLTASGRVISRQTFDSITIDGKSFPVQVVNNIL